MPAPVPLYADDEWRYSPGAELASVGGESEEEFQALLGLKYVDGATSEDDAWVAPRVDQLRKGTLRIADLTDDELSRGQVMDSDGVFRGGPKRKIPAEFHAELMRRIIMRGGDTLRGNYLTAVDTLVDVMKDEEVDAALRVNVAKYIVERLAGKTPERVEMTVEAKPWQSVLQGIIREPGRLDRVVVPGERVYDENGDPIDDEQVDSVL